MRGKPPSVISVHLPSGITPAGAGKTPFWCSGFSFPLGSPPQVRGKLWRALRLIAHSRITPAGAGKTERRFLAFPIPNRITPAGAGKTFESVIFKAADTDHPRRCGENLCFQLSAATTAGSPPQVRGKLPYATKTDLKDGITPAGAGKTLHSSAIVCSIGDHPRRCGENGQRRTAAIRQLGSPPQVRGKLIKKATL